jgi:hypothetical protein
VAAAAVQIQAALQVDSAHQNLAHPAAEAAKTDVLLGVEMACSAVDFPQHQAARTEAEETACSAAGMVGSLEEVEDRLGRRKQEALEEAFRVLLGQVGPQIQEDRVGRMEGREEVARRGQCPTRARVPWCFGAWGLVHACPERHSRRLCCQ